jgi:hypothetical protein
MIESFQGITRGITLAIRVTESRTRSATDAYSAVFQNSSIFSARCLIAGRSTKPCLRIG